MPFLERTGGMAVDLPGFGRSAKPADFPYSIEGYADVLEAWLRRRGCRALPPGRPRLGRGRPGAGPACAGARRAAGRHERRPVPAGLPLAPRRADLAHAAARRDVHGPDAKWNLRRGLREGVPNQTVARRIHRLDLASTSTTAPSARSSSSTAPRRQTSWPPPAATRPDRPRRRWSSGARRDAYMPDEFARRLRRRARRPGARREGRRRTALAVGRPARDRRPGRRLPARPRMSDRAWRIAPVARRRR